MATNPEFLAMNQIEKTLTKLEVPQRRRVFNWLQDKINEDNKKVQVLSTTTVPGNPAQSTAPTQEAVNATS